jgi:hypothetical protein
MIFSPVSTNALLTKIHQVFPGEPLLSSGVCLAYANGDDWSVQKIIDILRYRHWREISSEDICQCGFSELATYITPIALAYYLPSFMVNVLTQTDPGNSSLREVIARFFLPTSADSEDVWDYFGNGLLTRPLDRFAQELISRVDFLHDALSPLQRECVAQYIEIVESYGVGNPDSEFLRLLSKYSNFWRSDTDNKTPTHPNRTY